jgi:hypothetical protein
VGKDILANIEARVWRRLLPLLCVPLAILGYVSFLSAASPGPGSTASCHLPFVAKPVPTPTLTPTATPLPPIPNIHVERSCSCFEGGSRDDPNGEYVCFKNYESQPVDMTGWQVQDEAGHTYVFPRFILQAGAIVRLFSGPGSNTDSELHWARGLIWNNSHDTVYLYDALGRSVDAYVY